MSYTSFYVLDSKPVPDDVLIAKVESLGVVYKISYNREKERTEFYIREKSK